MPRTGNRIHASRIASALLALLLALLSPAAWAFKCDVDNNGFIDRRDLALIQQASLARALASGPDDPRDADNNGVINATDGRICALRCKYPSCASNGAPVADAGADQTVRVGERVRLNGAASSDPDGNPLSYAWTLTSRPAGSIATLAGANTVGPDFVADKPGNYVARLIVNDGKLASAPDSVTISTENSAPVANAGPDQTVFVGSTITLDGSRSSDVDGDLLAYSWELVTRPPGSFAALSDPRAVQPQFVVDVPGAYHVQLIVGDSRLLSRPDLVVVSTQNSPPVARPGADRTVPLGSLVPLDGSASYDVDGDRLSFAWALVSKPAGSTAVLADAASVAPRFTADRPGTYVVQLIVHDGQLASAAATVRIITANSPPTANAGPDQTVPLGALVQLDGSASSDPEGASLSHAWALITRPEGSSATIDLPSLATPRFTADRPGVYVAQLIVNDGSLPSAPDTVVVTTQNSRPVADAGPARTVRTGVPVALDGSASRDADGDALSYAWALTTRPAGSAAVISDPTAAAPGFTPDKAGLYVVQLIVSDGRLASEPATATLTAADNRAPQAQAQASPANPLIGTEVQLDGSASSDPDGDPITHRWTILSAPAGSLAAIVEPRAAAARFTPDLVGRYTIELVVSDGALDHAKRVTVDAQPRNRAPVALDDSFGWPGGQVLQVPAPGVLANDNDPDGTRPTAVIAQQPANGTVALNADGSFTYTPRPPVPTQALNVRLKWAWTSSTTLPNSLNVIATPAVIDLDGDGMPDIVFGSTSSASGNDAAQVGVLRALSGADGRELFTVTDPSLQISTAASVAVGDLDGDGKPEIVVSDASHERLIAFTYDGRLKWRSPVLEPINDGAAALADLDGDGRPEVIVGRQVLNGDGSLRWTGSAGHGGHFFSNGQRIGPLSIVADIDLDGTPEVIAGNTIYRADGSVKSLAWGATRPPVFYSIDITTDNLVKIDSGSGQVTVVGPLGRHLTDPDLAIMDGRLYAVDTQFTLQRAELLQIDTATGAATVLGVLRQGASPVTLAEGLTAKAGQLYVGFTTVGSSSTSGQFAPLSLTGEVGAVLDQQHDIDSLATSPLGRFFVLDSEPGAAAGDANFLRTVLPSSTLGSSPRGLGALNDLDFGNGGLFAISHDRPVLQQLNQTNGQIERSIALNRGGSYLGLAVVPELSHLPDGFTAVGNFDDDPFAEIVLVAEGKVWLLGHDGVAKWGPVTLPGGGLGGPPVVADVDGDGKPDIGVAGTARFTVFSHDGTVKWSAPTQDRSSGITGASVFDFDGDGTAEIVYRDELKLRVYRGRDGAVLFETPLNSGTLLEYPVIADIDGDGHAEIVIGANTNGGFGPLQGIYAFADSGPGWMPTRKIWNQHSYHVTNVNEDGTIPRREDINWLIPGLNNFRLNTFAPRDTAQADSFTYRASDGALLSNEATVRLVVQRQNRAPVFTSVPLLGATAGQPYVYDANAVDPDAGGGLTYALVSAPAGMTINPQSGLVAWTPTRGQAGSHAVTIRVQDAGGLPADQSFAIVVALPPNRAPIALDDRFESNAGGSLTAPVPGVLANDTDPDGDTLTARVIVPPQRGSLAFRADGSFIYTSNPSRRVVINFDDIDTSVSNAAQVSSRYQCSGIRFSTNGQPAAIYRDGFGGSGAYSLPNSIGSTFPSLEITTATFVDPTTGAPASTDFVSAIVGDRSGERDLITMTAYGLDGAVIGSQSYLSRSAGDFGTVTITTPGIHRVVFTVDNSSGANVDDFTFNAVSDTDCFGYLANDGQLDSSVAMVTIAVQPVNHPPVFTSAPIVGHSVGSCANPSGASWATRAPLSIPRYFPGSVTVGGQLFMLGGCTSGNCGGDVIASVEAYDSSSDTWSPRRPMSGPRGWLAAAEIAGRIFAVGGNTSAGPSGTLNRLEVYDPASDLWTTLAPMPTARTALMAGAISGRLYVAGGHGAVANTTIAAFGTLEVFDPASNAWTTLSPMPTPRAYAASGVIDGRLYIVGGLDAARGVLASLEVYDPVTDTWSTRRPMPTARVAPGFAVADGKLIVAGGSTASSLLPLEVFDVVEVYDPASDTWSTLPAAPTARYGPASAFVGGRLHVVGGSGNLQGNSSTPPLTVNEALCRGVVPYRYDANATDADGDALTYSLTAAPQGMTIDPQSGLIDWTPTPQQLGSHGVTVRVSDGQAFVDQSFAVAVVNPNRPPVISLIGLAPKWTKLAPAGRAPTARSQVGSTYDAINDRKIVFGGFPQPGGVEANDEVWVLVNAVGRSGAPEWQKLSPFPSVQTPAPRNRPTVAYDATANRLIVHGGCSEGNCRSALADTWVLTNANGLDGVPRWIQLPSSSESGLTAGHAYDPVSNRLMLFGGWSTSLGTETNAVRVLADANGIGDPRWIDLNPSGPLPPARMELYALGYDGLNNRLLVFGGARQDDAYNDLWVLKNANGLGGTPEWEQLVPSGVGPEPRGSMPVHYDPNSNRLIVFGGIRGATTPNVLFDDVWVLSHANGIGGTPTWTRLMPEATGPDPRRSHAAVYDPNSNRLVVGLGYDDIAGHALDDSWVLESASGLCTAGQICRFRVEASDPDPGDSLTYSIDGGPPGLQIDPRTGALRWIPGADQTGEHAATVRVTDRSGLFSTRSLTLTVAAVAVPNVVGLAPSWAESFSTAADLVLGTKTSRGGAVTLNFDSLPSRQGWTYHALGNNAPETRIFSISGGRLIQNSFGVGFKVQGGNRYLFNAPVDPRLPYELTVEARALQEELGGSCPGFQLVVLDTGVVRRAETIAGLRTDSILGPGCTRVSLLDGTTLRVINLRGVPHFESVLSVDAISVTGVDPIPRSLGPQDGGSDYTLAFGDQTGIENGRAEVTAYSFTQPRVVGQSPPAGTLVPNKSPVDLIIVDGPATETVPAVIGLTQQAATAAINAAKLILGPLTSVPHPTLPAGQVLDQSPLPGIKVPPDTRVAVVMSTGPPFNVAPLFTSTPVLTARVGQAYIYAVVAADANGDSLLYTLTQAPTGMGISAVSGQITWTPAESQIGPQSVTVRASDPAGLFAEQSFMITVSALPPISLPPSFTSSPPTLATVGQPYVYDADAIDPSVGDVLTYSLPTAPAGMTIDASTGLVRWAPQPNQAGIHAVVVRVQDQGGLFTTQSFSITVSPALACAVPPAGLTSWWPGEDSGLDRASANDAALENGVIHAAGRVGQSFRIDGFDDAIRVPNSRTTGFPGPFSVELWFNPASTIDAGTPNRVLLSKGRMDFGGSQAPRSLRALGGDGRLLLQLPGLLMVSTTGIWPAGTWQHVALTHDGTRYRLYVNGAEEATAESSLSLLADPADLVLGNADGFASAGFAGLLDETALYNRALTAEEVQALFAAGQLGKCTTPYSRADAGADLAVETDARVQLDGRASRAFDGTALGYQWRLTSRPADSTATLADATTPQPSITPDKPGPYTAELVVTNAGRASAPDTVVITATRVEHTPVITSTPPLSVLAGSPYTYAVTASDANVGDTLGYTLPVAPSGMTIDAAGVVRWTPVTAQIGPHPVTVRVQDPTGLHVEQAFVLAVLAPPVPVAVPLVIGRTEAIARTTLAAAGLVVGTVGSQPSETVAADLVLSQNPSAGTQVLTGSAVNFVLSSGPPQPTLVSIRLTPLEPLILTGQSQTFTATGILSNGSSRPLSAGLAWQSSAPAVAEVDATGLTRALNEGSTTISASLDGVSGTATLTVRQAVPDTTVPIAQISSPADGDNVNALVPIFGTASDTNFLKYTLEIGSFDTGAFTTLVVGRAPVANGTLAQLDPTTLVNDLYVLRLTVFDKADNRTSTEVTVQVTREKKVGNFTLAFQDVNVPMAGIPISVVRSYDSRDKTRGDFGIGWRLDVNSLRLRVMGIHGQGWQQVQSGGVLNRTYTLVATRSHKVAITLPDGKVEEFEMAVVPSSQRFVPLQVVDAVYNPRPQTRGSLRVLGESRLVTLGIAGNLDLLYESNLEAFNPQAFEYTTPDGQVVRLSRSQGVTQIRDRNGNTVSFGPGGITHSAGKSISFTRDGQGRITGVTDPLGNLQTYSYDFNGDLASHTDALGNRTGYLYNFNHGLIEITDPRGVRPIRNEYDDAGRLVSSTDALGKTITYTHDLGANREVITDRLGNQTIHVYDDLGNVTQTADALGGVTSRSYDARGNTLSETDPLGRTRSYTYDGQDNRLSETDPLGKTTRYTYNSTRQVLTITDALGRITSNTYDNAGNLTRSTDPAGNATSYTYDARGLQTTRTDALGHVTRYTYDAAGNLASETDALGRVTNYSYDAGGNRLSLSTTRSVAGGPQVLTTTFVYDANHRLTQTTHPDGSITRVIYNAIGKQEKTTDALGRETRYEYDTMGRLAKTTHADGTSETSTYDAEGRRTASADRAGRSTSYAYDALGRLTATTFADGASTATAFDAAGQVQSSTDARGNVTAYQYDTAGRRTRVTDASGAVTQFAYDDLGNQTRVTDANGNAVQFEYDANNRRTRTVYADGTADSVAYDALGRQMAKTDQAGITTHYGYDALGRLTSVTDALNQVTSYTYDEQGNQLTQTDAEGRTTSFEYDAVGRRIRRTLPLGMSETMSYDAAGNLRTKTDFNGKTTSYTYDNVNRLLSKTPDASLAGQAPISFAYNASGQRATMLDASGVTTYSYDSRDRLLAKATPQGTLNYSYDAAGNVTRIRSTRVGGADMSYAWDARNRLASVTDANGATTYAYDAAGNLASFLYPNGVEHRYTYNALNRLVNLTGAKGATTIAGYTYTLGPAGNRTAVAEANGRRVDYSYDALYRLTGETISTDPNGPNGTIGYVYDRVGNRLARTSSVAGIDAQVFAYDANDRITTESYDDNGNTLGSGGRTFGYDFENRLVSADGGVSFVYNGDGIRVGKTAGGLTTQFLVDDRNPTGYAQVVEEVVGGVVERSYTWGLKLISQKQAPGMSFYGFDGHGSVRYLSDSAGLVTDAYDYEAFGKLISSLERTTNPHLFGGEQFDGSVSMYYLRARYYSPYGGRFRTRDVWRGEVSMPGTLHAYLYGGGNPVTNLDPSGHFSVGVVAATAIIVGVVATMPTSIHAGTTLKKARNAFHGIFLRGHPVALGQDHVSIWIVPANQEKWAAFNPVGSARPVFINKNSFSGDRYFTTLGAGPERNNPLNFGRLISDFNRDRDVNIPKGLTIPVLIGQSESEEDRVIQCLIDRDRQYSDDLNYDIVPLRQGSDGYNSAGYVHGLLIAAGLAPPPLIGELDFPGWGKPVPSNKFGVTP